MDAHHFDLTGMPRPDQLGIEIHRKTLDGVKKMRNSHEQQLTWIDEALIEARKTFSSPQIYLIPKTPSTKRTQRVTEVVEDDESTDEQFSSRVQQKKKKHKMTTRRARALIEAEDTTASSQDDGFFLDAENKISKGDPDVDKEPVRKTRNRKKACMAAKSRRTRRNNNSATGKEEGKTSAPVGRGKSRSNRNQPASNSDSDMLSPVKMDVDSADGGNSTAVSDARNETLVSDAGSEMVSDAEKEMPDSGAGNEVQVSGPGNEVPVSGAGNEVLVSDDGNEVPVSDEGNEVPISDAENEVPISDDGNDMPVSDAGNEMPVSDVRKKMPVSDAKQVHILTISSSGDSDMSDEASARPQKASSSSTIRQKSSHTDQVSSSHTTDRVVPDAAAAEQMQDFHLLRVKEKASKFEKLVHVNGSSNDHCSNTTANSPRRPAVLTGPDAQAAKAAFDMLLGSAAKTQPVRRSSRLSAQSKPEESLTAKAPSLAWTKLQLMKAANACNETASPIPMRTTRSKMRAVMGKQKPEVCGEFRKDVMSSSDDEFRTSKPTTATASSHDASGIDRLGLNLPGRTTRSKMRKQLEKENLDSPTVKRPATAKIPQFTRLTPNNRQKPMLTNICMSSFLKRNTSSKKTELDLIKMKHDQLLAKEEESRKRRLRIQEQKLREAEEKRRNREHRQALAAERRREQEKRKQGLTEKELRKEQEKMVLKTKLQEQKQQEERERHKYREMKLEETRKREMEKQREKQEQILEQEAERHRQIENHLRKKLQEQQFCQKQSQENRKKNEEHQKKLEQERQLEAEKCQQAQQQHDKERELLLKEKQNREKLERLHREKMDIEKQNMNNRQKQMELEREKQMEHQRFKEEMAKTREACNAKEKERCPLMHAEKQADSPKPHQAEFTHHAAVNNKAGVEVAAEVKPGNSSQLNATFKKNEMNDENSDNYDMTPVRKVYSKCCCDENYNIDDIRSDDSTDEDEAPRKKIPSWATGEQLKLQLISQYYTPPDLDNIFGVIDMPDLCEMFAKKKPKFYKRTSSAVWNSPLYLPSGKPYQE